jgi:MFS superfamily sulfate permease-like transporter
MINWAVLGGLLIMAGSGLLSGMFLQWLFHIKGMEVAISCAIVAFLYGCINAAGGQHR